MTTDNLRYYEPGAKVPKEACKEFNNGRFKGTDINRMWRVRKLTEMFGPVGIGWTFNLTEIWERQIPSSSAVVIFAKGELKVKVDGEWSEPIIGYGGNQIVQSFSSGERINDEAYKMVGTDALGHACTFLGIGESVYWNEATKYTAQTEEPVKEKPSAKRETKKTTEEVSSPVPPGASPAKASTSASPSTPSDKEIMDTIFKAQNDAKLKPMITQWKQDNGIGFVYECSPEKRLELFRMIRSVA